MPMQIVDGAKHFGRPDKPARLEEVIRHQESPHSRLAARVGLTIPRATPANVAADKPVVARINHNRWVADCPDCAGAEYVFLDEPLFWCANCCNAAVGHKWRPIVLPQNKTAIEKIIHARQMPANRNWEPGETLVKLRADNRTHGVPEEV